jgi:hypothetical protein
LNICSSTVFVDTDSDTVTNIVFGTDTDANPDTCIDAGTDTETISDMEGATQTVNIFFSFILSLDHFCLSPDGFTLWGTSKVFYHYGLRCEVECQELCLHEILLAIQHAIMLAILHAIILAILHAILLQNVTGKMAF